MIISILGSSISYSTAELRYTNVGLLGCLDVVGFLDFDDVVGGNVTATFVLQVFGEPPITVSTLVNVTHALVHADRI